ncbi:MAG: hypothetical protein FJ298_11965 [Planctomycetes bacterium]|nr:hypothetical protein [Planctomycetota bacterium]
MVLAVSDEDAAKVGAYVDELGITVRVGAGSPSSNAFKIRGYPSSALIGPGGKLLWQGHPSGLSKGDVEAALKGAKPLPSGFLAFAPTSAPEGRVAEQAKAIEQGKLAKAHAALSAFGSDAKATEAEKTSASALLGELDAHVASLVAAAERSAKNREPRTAITVYDALAKEFGSAAQGASAKSAAEAIRKDAVLAKELDAAEAFEKLRASTAKLATAKRRDKLVDFAEKWKGTKAGERAKAMAKPAK